MEILIIVVVAIFILGQRAAKTAKLEQERMQKPSAENNNAGKAEPVMRQVPREWKPDQKLDQKLNQKKNIVEKAKQNNERNKEDVTLKEIEISHGHAEESVHVVQEHSGNCDALKRADALAAPESLLGSVEDLMVKGYSGNMEFERDFVGESIDMITNFEWK